MGEGCLGATHEGFKRIETVKGKRHIQKRCWKTGIALQGISIAIRVRVGGFSERIQEKQAALHGVVFDINGAL